MKILENLTTKEKAPTGDPSDGDLIRVQTDSGAILEKRYFAPVAPATDARQAVIPTLEFWRRLTADEQVGVVTSTAPGVVVARFLLGLSKQIDLDGPEAIAALAAAEDDGILTTARVAEIRGTAEAAGKQEGK